MYDSGNHKESHSREDICCRLFIGGLSPSVTSDSLHKYFSQYGTVQHCNVPKDPKTQRSKGYGFLTTAESVDSAQLHRPHVLDGRQVETKRAMPREEANNPEAHITTKKLFVGALRKDVTDQLLRDYFSAYGTIVDAYIVRDNATGDSRGFGFVVFDDYDPVDKVMLYKPHLLRAGRLSQHHGPRTFGSSSSLAGGGISGGGSGSSMQAKMGGPPGAMMMSGGAMGPWGPMMGPMMGGGSGPKPQQQQHGKQPQAASSKPSKSPAGLAAAQDPTAWAALAARWDPYGPMGMMGMMGPNPQQLHLRLESRRWTVRPTSPAAHCSAESPESQLLHHGIRRSFRVAAGSRRWRRRAIASDEGVPQNLPSAACSPDVSTDGLREYFAKDSAKSRPGVRGGAARDCPRDEGDRPDVPRHHPKCSVGSLARTPPRTKIREQFGQF
uniref:RRM domain-containing protein n=1 Tax=Macrostomum lignano TaxID=282301 RepID=A0A1I8F8Q3_9PLAT